MFLLFFFKRFHDLIQSEYVAPSFKATQKRMRQSVSFIHNDQKHTLEKRSVDHFIRTDIFIYISLKTKLFINTLF